jgi:phage terminase large subunit
MVSLEFHDDIFLPVYRPLVNLTSAEFEFFDIDFLYGGRDSGKSRHIAMQLVIDCLMSKYFRCVLVRKVGNTIKDSQWQLIKDVVEEWGLSSLFKFSKSPLEIRCANGNVFICRGLDEPTKLKSISNPSHCWVEEGNQITSEDFVTILTTLRYNEGNTKTWFSFNPECDGNYTDFWLWQEWFSHTTDLSFKWIKTVEVGEEKINYSVRATHSTYKDNPYCKPQRKALYESYKNSKNNAYWYQTYTLGLWGFKRSGGEFWKSFDEAQHCHDLQPRKSTYHVVVDNNVAPYLSVQLWQVDMAGKTADQMDEIPCSSPYNTAARAAKRTAGYFNSLGYRDIVYMYGDPSANAKSTIDDEGKSFFAKFIDTLRNEGFKIVDRVGKSAPSITQSASFINEIYETNYAGWKIRINNKCRRSIEDYTMVKEDAEGKMLKKREKDKDTGQTFERYGHFSDCKRYFITTILADLYVKYKAIRRRGGSYSARR